jgi:serine/threonine protein kinase
MIMPNRGMPAPPPEVTAVDVIAFPSAPADAMDRTDKVDKLDHAELSTAQPAPIDRAAEPATLDGAVAVEPHDGAEPAPPTQAATDTLPPVDPRAPTDADLPADTLRPDTLRRAGMIHAVTPAPASAATTELGWGSAASIAAAAIRAKAASAAQGTDAASAARADSAATKTATATGEAHAPDGISADFGAKVTDATIVASAPQAASAALAAPDAASAASAVETTDADGDAVEGDDDDDIEETRAINASPHLVPQPQLAPLPLLAPPESSSSDPQTAYARRYGDYIDLPPGSTVHDAYEIELKLGAGTMGEVYAARHIKLGKRVAIKVIAPRLSQEPRAVQRFSREASALARVHHPGIVAIEHIGELPDGRAFFVMEHLVGEPLDARLTRGPIPFDEALDILDQVARALDAAHRHGVIHRDLKPANTFLVRLPDEPRPVVKLLDFGLAKLAADRDRRIPEGTQAGVALGTPMYLSPEQALGPDVDARTDVYALGCLAYELLLGRLPFRDASIVALMAAHLHETPPRPSSIWPNIPVALDGVLFSMLAKRAAERPSLAQLRAVIASLMSPATGAANSTAARSNARVGASNGTHSAPDARAGNAHAARARAATPRPGTDATHAHPGTAGDDAAHATHGPQARAKTFTLKPSSLSRPTLAILLVLAMLCGSAITAAILGRRSTPAAPSTAPVPQAAPAAPQPH